MKSSCEKIIVMTITAMLLVLASCRKVSNSDDESATDPIVGTWTCNMQGNKSILTFKQGGKAIQQVRLSQGDCSAVYSLHGRYKLSGNKLTFTWDMDLFNVKVNQQLEKYFKSQNLSVEGYKDKLLADMRETFINGNQEKYEKISLDDNTLRLKPLDPKQNSIIFEYVRTGK